MGIIVAPILTNMYMAMLENEFKMKCKTDPKLIWLVLFKRSLMMALVLPKEIGKMWFIGLKNTTSYVKPFKWINITGAMLLIICICLYIKAMLFIRMANYLSLYIKKRHLSSCTSSLFSSKTHYQELCLGRVETLCASQHGREKFQKTQNAIFPATSQSWFFEISTDQAFPKRHILTKE